MSTNTDEEINTEADLSQLRPFLAKQHDNFVEMLQEPIDNAVSAVVENETYFEDLDPLTIQITIIRHENIVDITVADHGSGISREDIRDHIFSTADTSASEGILNNMGAGLKASLCWCEVSLDETEGVSPLENPFRLYTKPDADHPIYSVTGPVTANLTTQETTDEELWKRDATELPTQDHGTRVHLTCSRSDFDDDVWPMAARLRKKLQFLREVLGVRFQRLLDHEEAEIVIKYGDSESGRSGQFIVEPLKPVYSDNFDYGTEDFSVEDEDGVQFNVTYGYGVLDTDAIGNEVQDLDEGMYVAGNTGPLRWRYRQGNAGVDVYANGRILSIEEWPWESSSRSHNRFNRFHGQVTIIPQDPGEQVPTSNDKSDIDRTSRVWREIAKKISNDYEPIETFQRSTSSSTSEDEDTDPSPGDEQASSAEEGQETQTDDSSTDSSDEEGAPSTAADDSSSSTSSVEDDSDSDSAEIGDDSREPETTTSESSTSSPDTPTDTSQDTSAETSTSSEDDSATIDDNEEDSDGDTTGETVLKEWDELIERICAVLRVREETSQVTQDQIAGADIDIIRDISRDGTTLWLVCSERATPDAVYDLMMCQDHYKRSSMDEYTESILTAPALTDEAKYDFEQAMDRNDEHGHQYQFRFEPLDSVLE